MICLDQQVTNRKFTYSSLITQLIHYNSLHDWAHKEKILRPVDCMYGHKLHKDILS